MLRQETSRNKKIHYSGQSFAFHSCIMRDTEKYANDDVVGNNGATTVAQKGQGYTGQREKLHIARGNDKCLNSKNGSQTCC